MTGKNGIPLKGGFEILDSHAQKRERLKSNWMDLLPMHEGGTLDPIRTNPPLQATRPTAHVNSRIGAMVRETVLHCGRALLGFPQKQI